MSTHDELMRARREAGPDPVGDFERLVEWVSEVGWDASFGRPDLPWLFDPVAYLRWHVEHHDEVCRALRHTEALRVIAHEMQSDTGGRIRHYAREALLEGGTDG